MCDISTCGVAQGLVARSCWKHHQQVKALMLSMRFVGTSRKCRQQTSRSQGPANHAAEGHAARAMLSQLMSRLRFQGRNTRTPTTVLSTAYQGRAIGQRLHRSLSGTFVERWVREKATCALPVLAPVPSPRTAGVSYLSFILLPTCVTRGCVKVSWSRRLACPKTSAV